ncbi:hypothetical protein [Tautonia plasticadhaerens]|uniref:Uncharacterized protein n=1 Tax=Tautonia plasticadhaerens TaxID=2527974 RepID=A0A518H1I9_9BACT|nr:hypothetical protein [Tautonia plasticadhaerens]QDV34705.1 hypothetical protein ElP_25990 [Tautonia plasticadhaerens]
MTIETPSAHLALLIGGARTSDSVRLCDVSRSDDESDPRGGGVAVQMELSDPPGGTGTLLLSSTEAEAVAHALLRAIDREAGQVPALRRPDVPGDAEGS